MDPARELSDFTKRLSHEFSRMMTHLRTLPTSAKLVSKPESTKINLIELKRRGIFHVINQKNSYL
jgi:hypothetical protein